jgi:single-strand DNA-binding protein
MQDIDWRIKRMNKVVLAGRPTRDPEVRYSTKDDKQMAIARYTLAVDRKGKDAGADFINCVAFGKQGEFAEKYVKQGVKIAVSGRIQTGSYTNKDGQKVYTTDVIVEEHEFCEKKTSIQTEPEPPASDGYMEIPEGYEDTLPFK